MAWTKAQKDVRPSTPNPFLPWVPWHHAGSRNENGELFIWESREPTRGGQPHRSAQQWNLRHGLVARCTLAHWGGDGTQLRCSGAATDCATNGPPTLEKIRNMVHHPDCTFIGDLGQGGVLTLDLKQVAAYAMSLHSMHHTGSCYWALWHEGQTRTWLSSGRDGCIGHGRLQVLRNPFHPRSSESDVPGSSMAPCCGPPAATKP